jgi:hypothetical protein
VNGVSAEYSLDSLERMTTGRAQAPARIASPHWAALLEFANGPSQARQLQLTTLARDEVPPPYRDLLVHSRDMTPTLEQFYGELLELRPLRRQHDNANYRREVTLNLRATGRPVEYGVIQINLTRFSPAAAQLIIEAEKPLGAILASQAVAHMSWPLNFFRLESNSHLTEALHLDGPCTLYGRHNLLLDGLRRLLAEVIEVLAPVTNSNSDRNGHPSSHI